MGKPVCDRRDHMGTTGQRVRMETLGRTTRHFTPGLPRECRRRNETNDQAKREITGGHEVSHALPYRTVTVWNTFSLWPPFAGRVVPLQNGADRGAKMQGNPVENSMVLS